MLRSVEVINTELILNEFDTIFQHTDGALLVVDLVMDTFTHLRRQLGEDAVELGGTVNRAGNDERGTGLINKNGVHLIDDAVVVTALNGVIERADHVVAQVVKAQLVVGAVGDIAGIGLFTLRRTHFGKNDANGKTKPAVHTTHHLRVTLSQVVVNRHDVHALALKRIEVGRQQRGQGLALTGAHLSNVAEVQGGTAHDLHLVVLLIQHAPGSLTHGSKSLKQNVVKLLALAQALLKLLRLRLQLIIGELGKIILKGNNIISHLG